MDRSTYSRSGSGWESKLSKYYRDRSNSYKPKRDTIYVNGERQYVNTYNSMTDSPASPFKRNYVLMNASPDGMLHVSRRASASHDWSPRFLSTNFSGHGSYTPKRCQSTMDLRRSETYTSAEDLRYHTVRKAGSCDNIFAREHYLSPGPRSESGLSVSDIDSIFFEDDVQSQSSIGSADRSFCYSESDYERLESINEDEVMEDSSNLGSGSYSQTKSARFSHLSQGLVDPKVLTKELLKLKELRENRWKSKHKDVEAYIANNYPSKRNISSTSHDSCLGESIRTDSERSDFVDSGNISADNRSHMSSRRRLTYSTDSQLSTGSSDLRKSRGRSDGEDEFLTKSIETTYINNMPGIYEQEKGAGRLGAFYSRNVRQDVTTENTEKSQVNTKSDDEFVTTSIETTYINNMPGIYEHEKDKGAAGLGAFYSRNACEDITTENTEKSQVNTEGDDEFVTTSIETTYVNRLPGVYEHEKRKQEGGWGVYNRENIHKEVTTETATINNNNEGQNKENITVIDTTYFHNNNGVDFNYKKSKQNESSDSEYTKTCVETVSFTDENKQLDNFDFNSQQKIKLDEDDELRMSQHTIYVSQNNTQMDEEENEEKIEIKDIESSAVEIIHSGDQSFHLLDESSITSSRRGSSQFVINEQTEIRDNLTQISGENLFTTDTHGVNNFTRSETKDSVNLNRAERHSSRHKSSQSLITTTQVRDVLADDRSDHNTNSHHYLIIDEKPADDSSTKTTVVYNQSEASSRDQPSTSVKTQQLVRNDDNYDEYVLKGKKQVSNASQADDSRRSQWNSSEWIKTETVVTEYQDVNEGNSRTDEKITTQTVEKNQSSNINKQENIIQDYRQDWIIEDKNYAEIDENSTTEEEHFCDQLKHFERVDTSVIEIVKKDIVEVGVDHQESFITEEPSKVKRCTSEDEISTHIYSDKVTNTVNKKGHQKNTTQPAERFIDRTENIISQSYEKLIVPQNTITHQLKEEVFTLSSSSHLNNNVLRTDKTITTKADYSQDKEEEITDVSGNMDDQREFNRSEETRNVYEEEIYDNPEDFKTVQRSGVKISVVKNQNPILTRYKMQTISEQEEVNFSSMENLHESKNIAEVRHSNGIEISKMQKHGMNISEFRVSQQRHSGFDQNVSVSNIQDVNTCEIEDVTQKSHFAQSHNTLISQTTVNFSSIHRLSPLPSPNHRNGAKSFDVSNLNDSKEITFPIPSENISSEKETIHHRNLTLGEQGNENMGKSFQFVRDRTPSPEEWVTRNEVVEIREHHIGVTETESRWDRSTESININDISFISDTSSIYQASCSAEVNDIEESGYDTYPFMEHAESDFLNISCDSSSTYSAVCTAEVNVEIPGDEEVNHLSSSQNVSILSPTSEISDTESGYYTLTRSGKGVLARQDTSEDMTSYMNEDPNSTVYKTQMFGEMSEPSTGSVHLERALSTEDMTSFVETSTPLQKSCYESSLTESVTIGPTMNRVNSQEDFTSFAATHNLQDLVEFSEQLALQFQEFEEQTFTQIENNELVTTNVYNIEAAAEISSENLETESVASIEQMKVTKTEYFDSTDDLTGFIEYEVDSDVTLTSPELKYLNVDVGGTLQRASSTENLSRSIMTEEVATLRKQSVDHMGIDEGACIGVGRVNSSEDITSFENGLNTTEKMRSSNRKMGIDDGARIGIRRVNSTEDITSFEKELNTTQKMRSANGKMGIDDSARIGIRRVNSTEDITSFEKDLNTTENMRSTDRNMGIDDGARIGIRRVNSTEDITSFEQDRNITEKSQTGEQHHTILQHAQSLKQQNENTTEEEWTTTTETTFIYDGTNVQYADDELQQRLDRAEEDYTSSKQTTCVTEKDETVDEEADDFSESVETTYIYDGGNNRYEEDSRNRNEEHWTTTTETVVETTEWNQQREDEVHRRVENKQDNDAEDYSSSVQTTYITDVHEQIDESESTKEDVEDICTSVETTYIYDGGDTKHEGQERRRAEEHWTTTTETTTELTSWDQQNQESLQNDREEWRTETQSYDITGQTTKAESYEDEEANIQKCESEIRTRILLENRVSTEDAMRQSVTEQWTENVETFDVHSSSQTLEERLYGMITSESGIDHSEQFETLVDKDRNKIQMFIIYQDFTQMRERARLKKELALLSEQFEHLENSKIIDRSEQLLKINSFLDSFLLNLKITENLQIFKSKLEKVKHVETVHYYRDNTEMYQQMEKFSDLIRDLELDGMDLRLNIKLIYCLKFLKTKTLDAQFDSLCDFVCLESQKEDMELLQNHLCLTKNGNFGSRRLLKYLQRGFSQDMKTIWKPKIRNKLQPVGEDTELSFDETIDKLNCSDQNEPCCEFHRSDKESCAAFDLWSNSESVSETGLMNQKISRTGIIS
ncbi:hypothetical protein SNE40_013744 [Patella caerulea]|uniref:Uncharacterized protein n=1 Tax=Patella caerulea TaxID=87958 RepID=A0AAN8JJW9_PATCE